MSDPALPTVLLVDDEPKVLRGYRDVLRKQPFELLTASSALTALDILAWQRVDVVVSDERMPTMTGSQLLERIHRDYPGVIRIMLTGEASLAASVRAINDGLYRFLSKPIESAELRRVIHDALRMKTLGWAVAG